MKSLILFVLLFALGFNTEVGSSTIKKNFSYEKVGDKIYSYIHDIHTDYSSGINLDSLYQTDKYVSRLKLRDRIRVSINLRRFKERMGFMESRGNYDAKNRYGYLGKYQFSRRTLSGLGFSDEEINNFLTNAELQELAMETLIDHNLGIIARYGLRSFVGENVHGITITMEGLLAGAHLLGPYAVKQFLEQGKIKHDGNKTSIIKYIRAFSPTHMA